ncbi:MAG TPA: hypothetical protein VEH07_08755 [Alphaproteobacteria bacterium]|nr:hypothetical protein [Alphaproteobacteria bacterium]
MIGALGVIISLIYLALQVRADARARKSQTLHEMAKSYSEVMASLSHHADLADIVFRANDDMSSLKDNEAMRCLMYYGQMWRTFEDAFLQYRRGHLEASFWQGYEGPLNWVAAGLAPRVTYAFFKSQGMFSAEFAALMDEKIASIPQGPGPRWLRGALAERQSPAAATAAAAPTAGGAATHSGG